MAMVNINVAIVAAVCASGAAALIKLAKVAAKRKYCTQ
jgi:hypothetical protein